MSETSYPIKSSTLVEVEMELIQLSAILQVRQERYPTDRTLRKLEKVEALRSKIQDEREQYWDNRVNGHLDKIIESVS